MFLDLYLNTVHFIVGSSQRHADLISPATKRMFCNVERFVFAHTRKISNCCCKNFEVNFENSRTKEDSNLESCGKSNNI